AAEDRDLARAASLEELRPGGGALDRVVEADHLPAARLGQHREVAREGADVEQPPALARRQESQRVPVATAVILEVPGLPGRQPAARPGGDLGGDGVAGRWGDLVGRPRPERHVRGYDTPRLAARPGGTGTPAG